MDEAHINHLAGGYCCHVAPYRPSGAAAGTRLYARHGQGRHLLSAPGYVGFPPAVHWFGADGNSTADIQACSVDGCCSCAAAAHTVAVNDPDADQDLGSIAGTNLSVSGDSFGPSREPLADHVQAQLLVLGFYAPGVESSGSADLFALISESTVQSVWRENCAEVFMRVLDKLRQPRRHLYIALDLEFVADASTDVRYRSICWIDWYEHLRTFVNDGDVLQVGLAFAFDLRNHHGHGGGAPAPSPVIALEINLQFDKDARQYNAASIAFLSGQGHRLAEHRDRGVTAEQLLDGLLRHLPFSGDLVTWVTYHGDHDFGFLLRTLQDQQQGTGRGALPSDRAAFMGQVRRLFPVFYDVRVLGQLVVEGFKGKLTVLAELLRVQRIGGEHHAGSDALLTMSCFSGILRRSQHELHRLDSRQCLLSGMEEHDMGIRCSRHIDDATVRTVKVGARNFDDEARWIGELVTSNFKIVGLDVQLPQLGLGSLSYAGDGQQDYSLMKSRMEEIKVFQVVIGFMNAEGMVAFGRVWKFYLSFRVDPEGVQAPVHPRNLSSFGVDQGDETPVHPRRLASLINSCGATHNRSVAWVTSQGSHGIACPIQSFMRADGLCLPSHWYSYTEHQSACFPALHDVGFIAQRCQDFGMHRMGTTASSYGVAPKHEVNQPVEKALQILRCYNRLAESPYFPPIASAVQEQRMASQRFY